MKEFWLLAFVLFIVTCLPTYLFWSWLFGKLIKNKIVLKLANWSATIFVTPLIYCTSFFLLAYIVSYYPDKRFNEKDWLVDKQRRYELTGDLVKSKLLIKKTPLEVKNLLGIPTNESSSNKWSYFLGSAPGLLGSRPGYLEIEFQNEKVVNVTQEWPYWE
jgi:hypothetical protein